MATFVTTVEIAGTIFGYLAIGCVVVGVVSGLEGGDWESEDAYDKGFMAAMALIWPVAIGVTILAFIALGMIEVIKHTELAVKKRAHPAAVQAARTEILEKELGIGQSLVPYDYYSDQ